MRFVTVAQRYFDMCADDPELLYRENRRPHLLVLALEYKGRVSRFAIPLRSNISPKTPKEQYFVLPPRPSTRPGNHHGIHYTKMFPITKEYQEKFWVGEKSSYALFQEIIKRNEKRIIDECQRYLDDYAAGRRPKFSVDIDRAFARLEAEKEKKETDSLG